MVTRACIAKPGPDSGNGTNAAIQMLPDTSVSYTEDVANQASPLEGHNIFIVT